ncbi:SCO family protein [Ideonella paludis]|uniref:SCO family protein n=1 Tax=Ideonella paludis TaxID=1233411 RepID=A0ABS5DXR5_9BURK|nr:SCO family protein [Ideonella paludis]MBQ0935940.1 SCO family protein [Ideonella paludis]
MLLAVCGGLWAHGAAAKEPANTGMSSAWRQLKPSKAVEPRFQANSFGLPLAPNSLIRQDGKPMDLARFQGKPVLLNFAFTDCSTICTPTTLHLAKVRQDALAAGIALELVTITVNPLGDTPERLKAFAQARQADHSNWHWLTGQAELVFQVIDHYGALVGKRRKPDDHRTSIYLINRNGEVFNDFPVGDFDHERMQRELRGMSNTTY